MRIWVDLTNSPHVLVLRPIVAALRAGGHEVQITARDFAQTLQLLERYRMDHTAIGSVAFRPSWSRIPASGSKSAR